jgi:hypothetical protein
MPAGARLLLVEYVLPEADGQAFGKLLDLHMMVLLGGLERTEVEYRRLFAAHGFRLTRERIPSWPVAPCATPGGTGNNPRSLAS